MKLPADIRDYFARMGAEGGRIGGKIRAGNLSAERRQEIARQAVNTRWDKYRAQKHPPCSEKSLS